MIITKKPAAISPLFRRASNSACLLCLLLLSPVLPGCDQNSNKTAARDHQKQLLHSVEVVSVENRPVFLQQTVSGTLEAITRIRLYNDEGGRITELPYHEGDYVKQGSLLVQLDNELLKTDVATAVAAREQAELDLSRLIKLLPKKVASEEEVAKARTLLELAATEEKRQRIRLQRTTGRAPIDGVISERLFEPGDLLAQQSHILTIIDPSSLVLKAPIAERWLPLLRQEQPVTLSIDALGETKFEARILRIHPTITASTHKGIIELLLKPVPAGARAGQFARAEIDLLATDRLVIPAHAILYDADGAYVYRLIDDDQGDKAVEKIYFEQGQQFGALTEILSGLAAGDKVVSRGYLGLRHAKKVAVTEHSETPAGSPPAAITP